MPSPTNTPRQHSAAVASASVYLAFEPSLEFVQRVVQWLTDFCYLTLKDLDAVSRLQLAVNELVENVVKYGLQPDVRVEAELEKRDGRTILRLCTYNRAPAEQLQRAADLLTDLNNAEDPIAFYDRLVLETAPLDGVSGLGLARIKAEGELDIDFELDGDLLKIIVEADVDRFRVSQPC